MRHLIRFIRIYTPFICTIMALLNGVLFMKGATEISLIISSHIWKFYYRSPLYVCHFYENVYLVQTKFTLFVTNTDLRIDV